MAWPRSTDYIEAVQNLHQSMADEELRAGQLTKTPLGLPMVWSGGFADVYKIHNASTGSSWALKCFTKKVEGQAGRYEHISAHLSRARLPFMVDFRYLHQGIRVQGEWYPAVKMHWVEGGLRLNEFVEQYLNRPRTLKELLRIWVKMADRLRQASVGHCDLQHGNVLMVPRDGGSLALRLIDYDGVHVPSLAGARSPELGHPAFQHPQRSRERVYSAEVDRFSHLAIYTAIHCLTVGREKLWKRFNNGENLLFREEDYRHPGDSEAFQTLWRLPDEVSRALVGRLALAANKPLQQTPLLTDFANGHVFPLTQAEENAIESILGRKATTDPTATTEPDASAPAIPRRKKPVTTEHLMEEEVTSWLGPSRTEETAVKPLTEEELASVWESRPPSGDKALLKSEEVLPTEDSTQEDVMPQIVSSRAKVTPVRPPSLQELASERARRTSADAEALREAPPEAMREPVGLPEFTNTIGMRFKLIPAGEFLMGSPEDDPARRSAETPQHRVRITRAFYLGMYAVTQEQYEKVMGENPSRLTGLPRPVEQVSWQDAMVFCAKLLEMDTGREYRLPTEAEWEYACRAGTTTRYSCGDTLEPQFAWFSDNSGRKTHPVGEKRANPWGLYDMHGNVSEWCQDWYESDYSASPPLSVDPTGPSHGTTRVRRGGGWKRSASACRSADRGGNMPRSRFDYVGFRVAFVPEAEAPVEPAPAALEMPEDLTDALGMKFKRIPAGEFTMGSPEEDSDKAGNEIPQYRVRITKPFYLGIYEVTQERYEDVMGGNPSRFTGRSRPVEQVSWKDATEFCAKLSEMDDRFEYRLPTEAEWEYACRAGTTTRYSCGDTLDPQFAWFSDNSDSETHPVGEKRANPWGLYDMHGNVLEWCQDWYDTDYSANPPLMVDPTGPYAGSKRVRRGGSWHHVARGCRSAARSRSTPDVRFDRLGFRVVLIPTE